MNKNDIPIISHVKFIFKVIMCELCVKCIIFFLILINWNTLFYYKKYIFFNNLLTINEWLEISIYL
jgi:hypothetical protein